MCNIIFSELFSLAASLDPKSRHHSRIIWSCSWSHDDRCFVTASRDKKVMRDYLLILVLFMLS